jgi:hypothetical protein
MKKNNGYGLSRQWFDFAFENCTRVTSNHTALYMFLIEINNRLGWIDTFQITSTECMCGMSCKSHNTYIKTFNDLVQWGFVKVVVKSKNQYQCNIIALSKFDEALDKALDKALAKHLTEHLTYSKTINHKPKTINIIEPNKFDSDSVDGFSNYSKNENAIPSAEEISEKKKVAPKKKSDAPILDMEKTWSDHLTKMHSIAYYADGRERAALVQIAKKLVHQVNEKSKREGTINTASDQEKAMSGWNYMLANFSKWSEFNQKLTKLSQINGQFTNIIAECKASGANKPRSKQPVTFEGAAADYIKRNFGEHPLNRQTPQGEQANDDFVDHQIVD